MEIKFSPSLMCMDFLNIKEQIEVLNNRADMLHVDIMDGHFVKNITLSPDFVRSIKKVAKIPMDCHLMVTNPEDYIDTLAEAGADYICPHAETLDNQAFRVINEIKARDCKVGIVLSPATPLDKIKHYIHLIDKLTILTVDPGYAGQPFIEEMLEKIECAKKLKEEKGYKYLIEIDGSCNKKTFKKLINAGAEVLIVGSSGLFGKDKDLNKAWEIMIEEFQSEIGK